jgi:hypothetical protein
MLVTDETTYLKATKNVTTDYNFDMEATQHVSLSLARLIGSNPYSNPDSKTIVYDLQ